MFLEEELELRLGFGGSDGPVSKMTQAFWKVYKTKVLQTFGGELQEEEQPDEVMVSVESPLLPQPLSKDG